MAKQQTSQVVPRVPAIPDPQAIRTQMNGLVRRAEAIAVTSEDGYAAAGEFIKIPVGFLELIKSKFKPAKDAMGEALRVTRGIEAELLAVPQEARDIVEAKMLGFQTEKRKVRERQEAEARARAEEEARVQRERELAELRKKQELERRAYEAQQAELRTKRDAESRAAAARLKEERQQAEAEAERKKADLAAAPLAIPAVPAAQRPIAKPVDGIQQRRNWKAEVVDLPRLIHAAAADPELMIYLRANEVQIGKIVRASNGNIKIPGVRTWAEEGIAVSVKDN